MSNESIFIYNYNLMCDLIDHSLEKLIKRNVILQTDSEDIFNTVLFKNKEILYGIHEYNVIKDAIDTSIASSIAERYFDQYKSTLGDTAINMSNIMVYYFLDIPSAHIISLANVSDDIYDWCILYMHRNNII